MSDLEDMRLTDELIGSARTFGLTIQADNIYLMPREWSQRLVKCLMARIQLRGRLRTPNFQSLADLSQTADRTQELDRELWELLLAVADTRPTRN